MYFYLSKILGPILIPSNFLFLFLIVFFILYLKNKNKKILNILSLIIFLIITIAFLPIGNFGLKYLEKDFISTKEYKNIKNIIVLSGDNERILASIRLAYKYPASRIFYVGGNAFLIKSKNNDDPTFAKKFYKELNFDLNRVIFVGKSRNTIENFKEIKELDVDFSQTVLITTAYHMKRSMIIAKKQGVKVQPYPVNFTSTSVTPLLNSYQGFNVTKNLSNFNTFFREMIGIFAFILSY